MQIYHIAIQHFRGIEQCSATLKDRVVCLIGPGDSTKSTILDAIEYALCPNWFIPLDDSDFTNTDISKDIVIDVTIGPVPDDLLSEAKFGLHLRGFDLRNATIHDEPEEQDVRVLTIRVKINRDLTPEWFVVTDRDSDGIRISNRDRQRFRVVRIGAHIDNELSWARGSALLSLTEDTRNVQQLLLGATRKLRSTSGLNGINDFDASVDATKTGAQNLGLALASLCVDIDPKSLRTNAGTLSLHNGKVPARRLGMGTRRLLAIGAQLQAMQKGTIVLIDEIEHALEPHRIKHLTRTLMTRIRDGTGQMIITSHSPAALEELGAAPLHVVQSSEFETVIRSVNASAQGTVRAIPAAFLSPRVIVCEGPTEVGLLRSYEKHILSARSESLALHGTLTADGGGSTAPRRASDLQKHGYDVCLFADSDTLTEWNPSKESLVTAGIDVITWADGCCTEKRVIDDLPNGSSLFSLVEAVVSTGIQKQSVLDAVNASLDDGKLSDLDDIPNYGNASALKRAICKAALSDGKAWFKTVGGGEVLGDFIFSSVFPQMESTDFFAKLKAVEVWILAKR